MMSSSDLLEGKAGRPFVAMKRTCLSTELVLWCISTRVCAGSSGATGVLRSWRNAVSSPIALLALNRHVVQARMAKAAAGTSTTFMHFTSQRVP